MLSGNVCQCSPSYFTALLTPGFTQLSVYKVINLWSSPSRQEKETWIKSKYVEKRFLKKMSGSEALVEGERKSRPWTVKKCHRHNSSVRAPNKARRKYHRYEPGSASPANLSAGQRSKFLNTKNLMSSVAINLNTRLTKSSLAGCLYRI